MQNLNSISKFMQYAVKETGDKMLFERKSGMYEYIPNSEETKSSVHTGYDIVANQTLLGFIPQLAKIAEVSEIVIISEEMKSPLKYNVKHNEFVNIDMVSNFNCYTLILDPICGSIPYVRGVPDFVVTAALLFGLTPMIAVVYQPNTDEMFYAIHEQGAFLNGKPLDVPSKTTELKWSYISIEHKVFREAPIVDVHEIVKQIMRLRTAGTCALEMCYVACGRLDCLIKLNQPLYDYLAGAIIMQEAGLVSSLVLLDGETRLMPLSGLDKIYSFLATNGIITNQLAHYTKKWIV
jgi:fructose-1,6-bisphosphatase/inositol monophosphatase family enzyme